MVVSDTVRTSAADIAVHLQGSGPPVLLLHGFPETSLMWREVAQLLSERFTVVCADLRGYGDSSCPPSGPDHATYAKRAMALDAVEVMTALGFDRFAVVGHDRGGRVAYRTALDHPERITHLAVLDVVPIDVAWDRADDRLALGFWPWSLLAQPEPLPERLVGAAPEALIDAALGGSWGTPAEAFSDDARAACLAQLADPDHLHAICEEYRAAASVDREHDRADREADRRIDCPTLVLWSGEGPLAQWYADAGGPLGVWRDLAPGARGGPVAGGHFFPEEHPRDTARALAELLSPDG